MNLKDHIRSIQDYPKKGILFRDITTLIKNNGAFTHTIDLMVENSKDFKIDKIAAMESRGFVFASALSYILKKPFILLRKKNKLPAETHSVDFELEYGTATMEVHKDSIEKNDNVELIHREKNSMSVYDVSKLIFNEYTDVNKIKKALGMSYLSEEIKTRLTKTLVKLGHYEFT